MSNISPEARFLANEAYFTVAQAEQNRPDDIVGIADVIRYVMDPHSSPRNSGQTTRLRLLHNLTGIQVPEPSNTELLATFNNGHAETKLSPEQLLYAVLVGISYFSKSDFPELQNRDFTMEPHFNAAQTEATISFNAGSFIVLLHDPGSFYQSGSVCTIGYSRTVR